MMTSIEKVPVADVTMPNGSPAPDATPATQKAIVQTGMGGPEVLQYQSIPVLGPGEGQVLIRVFAASVNPGDWKFRTGIIFKEAGSKGAGFPGAPPPGASASKVPGGDVAGVIEKLGSGVTAFKVGEPVLAVLNPMDASVLGLNGGYSQYVVVSADNVAGKPETLTYAEAAGLGRAGTMAARLVSDAAVSEGQRVLIAGAGGGIGSLAVQIAKVRGARVVGVASGQHARFLESLGVDEQIDYTLGDWSERAKNIDVGIDTVGGDSALQVLEVVRRGGTFISVLPNAAVAPETCSAAGVNCLPAPRAGNDHYLARLVDLARAGRIKVRIAKSFPLAEAAEAQEASRAGHTQGKIILAVDEERAHAK
jgi:NADPH:quinone reductase-like Zn-dependent oxidoreductase